MSVQPPLSGSPELGGELLSPLSVGAGQTRASQLELDLGLSGGAAPLAQQSDAAPVGPVTGPKSPDTGGSFWARTRIAKEHLEVMAASKIGAAAVRLGAVACMGVAVAGGVVHGVLDSGPTQVPMHLSGARVSVDMVPNSRVDTVEAGILAVDRVTSRSIGPVHIGTRVHIDAADVSLKTDGKLDATKATGLLSAVQAQLDEVEDVVQADKEHAAKLGGLVGASEAAGLIALVMLAGTMRRGASTPEAARAAQVVRLTAAGLLLGVAASASHTMYGALSADPHDRSVVPVARFAGTPAEGLQVRVFGGLEPEVIDVIDKIGAFLDEKNTFYGGARDAFEQQLLEKFGTQGIPRGEGETGMLVCDDFAGIDGMASLATHVAHRLGAKTLIAGGDVSGTGSRFETIVQDALRHDGRGLDIVVTPGHHDSNESLALSRERKFIIADGKLVEQNGVQIFGIGSADEIPYTARDARPRAAGLDRQTVITNAIEQLRELEQQGIRPLIVAHDKEIARVLAAGGWGSAIIGGQNNHETTATQTEGYVQIHQGTTGGHGEGDGVGIAGKPANPAYMSYITVDRDNRITSLTSIIVYPHDLRRVVIADTIRFELPEQVAQPATVSSGSTEATSFHAAPTRAARNLPQSLPTVVSSANDTVVPRPRAASSASSAAR